MPFDIFKYFENAPQESSFQYLCFLTYDAQSMAQKLSKAYSVEWKIFELETMKIWPKDGSVILYQMLISEGPHKHMILITPHSENNIFSEYLDTFGEGFHHNCFLYDKPEEYQTHKSKLLESRYSIIQICSYLSNFESSILKHPDSEFMLEILFIAK